MALVTDDDRGEYLRMLEDDAKARAARRVDPVRWALVRHMKRRERVMLAIWLWLLGAR